MALKLSLLIQIYQRFLFILFLILITACFPQNHTDTPNLHSATSECRVIKHWMGEACVPANPQRIIVLDTNPLDAVLALGVKPIGSPGFEYLSLPEAQTKEIEIIGSNAQPSLEKIALLKPDLILGIQWNAEIYPQLSQIAPTVMAPANDPEWKEDLRLYAQALGKTEKAEQLLQDYHERIQEFQQRMGDKLQQTEVSIVTTIAYGSSLPARIYLSESFMGSVVQEAGLQRPTAQNTLPFALTQNWAIDVSIERLDLIDGDVIFAANTDPQNSELKSTLSALQQNPLWSNLNAVKQGKVYTVSYDIWVAQRNIGGANRILDDLFKYLVEEND
ncbi:iron-siderophore ABC transporter substrate-binding protein [Gloeocapsopsis sp. IPPAS B-1203]|uniref:iron-siderophore ABC transporter substrate-binding protein n=1 Tax=Gloeocapsopsis sp. IPPAS B-1203 TaxID=2049454 RepID=UPI000C176006|nr:iron-siderophore ABC transporter substrate-binding protein [Gloeocapsopsis sp. IPPAS B-1203]PIG95282.1 Fe3+-citrate ABC transporter substrate-binding protein [Gloeocapsopsis sp. IPPAS B-1203]